MMHIASAPELLLFVNSCESEASKYKLSPRFKVYDVFPIWALNVPVITYMNFSTPVGFCSFCVLPPTASLIIRGMIFLLSVLVINNSYVAFFAWTKCSVRFSFGTDSTVFDSFSSSRYSSAIDTFSALHILLCDFSVPGILQFSMRLSVASATPLFFERFSNVMFFSFLNSRIRLPIFILPPFFRIL